jgi:formylglycine-generating enzyme required for sulfatase activity
MSGLPVFQSLEDVEFVERLGAGLGAGRFKARLAHHDAPVALLLESPGHTDRGHFVAWAQRLARLDHPCIPRVVHVEQVLEPTFVALAYSEGRTLDQALSDPTAPLGPTAALTALTKVAAGLRAAHAAEIVHGALAARCVVLEARPHADEAVRVTGWIPCPMPLPAGVVAEDARALLALARPHLPPDTPLPSDADVRCVDDVLQVILPTLADRLTEERARAASDLAAAQSERAQAVEARAHARALAVALRTARQAALAAETRAAEHLELDRRRALDRWTHQRMELELLLGRPLVQAELPVAEAPSTPPAPTHLTARAPDAPPARRRPTPKAERRPSVMRLGLVAVAGAGMVVMGWALSLTEAPEPEAVQPPVPEPASTAPFVASEPPSSAPVTAPPGMAYVPAGLVSMGLTPAQVQVVLEQCRVDLGETAAARACTPALLADEAEAAPAKVDAFFIDQLEVSQAQWDECVAAKRCEKQRLRWDLPTQPITGVTRAMASVYCAYREGRLPTSDEWLRAARGDDARAFPWGDTQVRDPEGDRANSGAYVKGKRVGGRADGHPYPAPVSTFAARGASPFGVANLSGNVREWTATDAGPGGRTAFVLGGGWKSLGHELRLSRREVVKPEDFAADLGLRCVRDEKK